MIQRENKQGKVFVKGINNWGVGDGYIVVGILRQFGALFGAFFDL
jgi:hypothetical protein